MTDIHSAEGPAIGYYYQSMFALLRLLESPEDGASVSVETHDDVELVEGQRRSLLQLKHSIQETPPKVSVKSVQLWQSLAVWSDKLDLSAQSQFILVTCSEILADDPAIVLQGDGPRGILLASLRHEADRVIAEVERHQKKNGKPPHQKKLPGCKAFVKLSAPEQEKLLSVVYIRPQAPSAGQISKAIVEHPFLAFIPQPLREQLCRRLIEWFDLQVLESLLKKRARVIHKSELQDFAVRFLRSTREDSLPDEFGRQFPPSDWVLPRIAAKQIEIIEGQSDQVSRAARECWRASAQRNSWLDDDLSGINEIQSYNNHLIEEWADHRDSFCSTISMDDEKEVLEVGRRILDWTHFDAPGIVDPIRGGWLAKFWVRGSYQLLANEGDVGWHPRFQELIQDDD